MTTFETQNNNGHEKQTPKPEKNRPWYEDENGQILASLEVIVKERKAAMKQQMADFTLMLAQKLGIAVDLEKDGLPTPKMRHEVADQGLREGFDAISAGEIRFGIEHNDFTVEQKAESLRTFFDADTSRQRWPRFAEILQNYEAMRWLLELYFSHKKLLSGSLQIFTKQTIEHSDKLGPLGQIIQTEYEILVKKSGGGIVKF